MKINRILIAAPASGSGKSVLSAGIMAHFADELKGLRSVPIISTRWFMPPRPAVPRVIWTGGC